MRLERGLPSWPKAQDLRSCLAGVRGFESRTPHFVRLRRTPFLSCPFQLYKGRLVSWDIYFRETWTTIPSQVFLSSLVVGSSDLVRNTSLNSQAYLAYWLDREGHVALSPRESVVRDHWPPIFATSSNFLGAQRHEKSHAGFWQERPPISSISLLRWHNQRSIFFRFLILFRPYFPIYVLLFFILALNSAIFRISSLWFPIKIIQKFINFVI